MEVFFIIIDFIEEHWAAFDQRCNDSNMDAEVILQILKDVSEEK
jgi:hypothetical protein